MPSPLTDQFMPPQNAMVVENTPGGGRVFDDETYLLQNNRIISLKDQFNSKTCGEWSNLLLILDSQSHEDIQIYIDSPGGSITAGAAIFGAMMQVESKVCTINVGMAASMGAYLLASGTPGCRFSYPDAITMVHQPSGGAEGKVTDIKISEQLVSDMREMIQAKFAHYMGLDYKNEKHMALIDELMERDTYVNALTAQHLGLIDGIVLPKNKTAANLAEFELVMNVQRRQLDRILNENNHDRNAIAIRAIIKERESLGLIKSAGPKHIELSVEPLPTPPNLGQPKPGTPAMSLN